MSGSTEQDPSTPRRFRRKQAATRRREARAWALNAQGYSTRAIAAMLAREGLGAVGHTAVGRMLRRVEDRTLANMTEICRAEKVRQLQALAYQYAELTAAWERSKQDAQVARQQTVEGPAPPLDADGNPLPGFRPGGRKVETLEVRGQCGDASYLAGARAALADRRKILGLDAPERRELSGPGGAPLAVEVSRGEQAERARLRRLTDEELEQYVALMGKLAGSDPTPDRHQRNGSG